MLRFMRIMSANQHQLSPKWSKKDAFCANEAGTGGWLAEARTVTNCRLHRLSIFQFPFPICTRLK
jgi:hypothetical protein